MSPPTHGWAIQLPRRLQALKPARGIPSTPLAKEARVKAKAATLATCSASIATAGDTQHSCAAQARALRASPGHSAQYARARDMGRRNAHPKVEACTARAAKARARAATRARALPGGERDRTARAKAFQLLRSGQEPI